jgi:hypothetical protein
MNDYEFGQQIYSMWLAAIATSGKPMPATQDCGKYAQVSYEYAKAYRRENANESKEVL